MNIAELLLNIQNEYNGHLQTVIKGLSIEQGREICKSLEEYTDNQHSFVLELWTDNAFTIWQKDGLGPEKDRMILSTDG